MFQPAINEQVRVGGDPFETEYPQILWRERAPARSQDFALGGGFSLNFASWGGGVQFHFNSKFADKNNSFVKESWYSV